MPLNIHIHCIALARLENGIFLALALSLSHYAICTAAMRRAHYFCSISLTISLCRIFCEFLADDASSLARDPFAMHIDIAIRAWHVLNAKKQRYRWICMTAHRVQVNVFACSMLVLCAFVGVHFLFVLHLWFLRPFLIPSLPLSFSYARCLSPIFKQFRLYYKRRNPHHPLPRPMLAVFSTSFSYSKIVISMQCE